jgi:hypothetical protein
MSHFKFNVVLHIINGNFLRFVFYIQNIVTNTNLFFGVTSATLVSLCQLLV